MYSNGCQMMPTISWFSIFCWHILQKICAWGEILPRLFQQTRSEDVPPRRSSGDELGRSFSVEHFPKPIGSMVLVYIYIYTNIKGVYWWDPCYHIWHTWILWERNHLKLSIQWSETEWEHDWNDWNTSTLSDLSGFCGGESTLASQI